MITIDNKPLQLSEEQEKNIRLEIAVMLYEKADYSFYVAAKFAGLHLMDFVKELGKREISIYSEETFFKDLETIKKFGK
jgi:predicted HTH domain antitoxin